MYNFTSPPSPFGTPPGTSPAEDNRYYIIFVILALAFISLIQPSGRILDSSMADSFWMRASPLARLVDMCHFYPKLIGRAMLDLEQPEIMFHHYRLVMADRYIQRPQDNNETISNAEHWDSPLDVNIHSDLPQPVLFLLLRGVLATIAVLVTYVKGLTSTPGFAGLAFNVMLGVFGITLLHFEIELWSAHRLFKHERLTPRQTLHRGVHPRDTPAIHRERQQDFRLKLVGFIRMQTAAHFSVLLLCSDLGTALFIPSTLWTCAQAVIYPLICDYLGTGSFGDHFVAVFGCIHEHRFLLSTGYRFFAYPVLDSASRNVNFEMAGQVTPKVILRWPVLYLKDVVWGAPSLKVCLWFALQISLAETGVEYLAAKMGIRASPDHIRMMCWEVLVFCLGMAWLPNGPTHPFIARALPW